MGKGSPLHYGGGEGWLNIPYPINFGLNITYHVNSGSLYPQLLCSMSRSISFNPIQTGGGGGGVESARADFRF